MVDGLAALGGRPQHDLEMLTELRLADEVVEPLRAQRRLLGALDHVGVGAQDLLAAHRVLVLTP